MFSPNIDLNLDEKESRFIPSVVFDNNKSIDFIKEQAFILGVLYHKVTEKHHLLRFKLSTVSLIFILIGGMITAFGPSSWNKINITILGSIIIILALTILIYAFFIDKPMKLIKLSKVYITSYIIPFNSALIIDACDIIPAQNFQYNDIFLDGSLKLSQELPDPPVTFKKEQHLLTLLQNKRRLLEKFHHFSWNIPVLLNNDFYTQAVHDCMQVSQSGIPNNGILKIKVDYQTALEYISKIRFFSELENSISVIKNDIAIMQDKVDPFIKNLEICISNIDTHFSQVTELLNNHFFSEVKINDETKVDKRYGYGITQHKYHIRVGSCPKNRIPLNPIQNVIDRLDETVRDSISTKIREGENLIAKQKQELKFKVQQINRNADNQINPLKIQINEKNSINAYSLTS